MIILNMIRVAPTNHLCLPRVLVQLEERPKNAQWLEYCNHHQFEVCDQILVDNDHDQDHDYDHKYYDETGAQNCDVRAASRFCNV